MEKKDSSSKLKNIIFLVFTDSAGHLLPTFFFSDFLKGQGHTVKYVTNPTMKKHLAAYDAEKCWISYPSTESFFFGYPLSVFSSLPITLQDVRKRLQGGESITGEEDTAFRLAITIGTKELMEKRLELIKNAYDETKENIIVYDSPCSLLALLASKTLKVQLMRSETYLCNYSSERVYVQGKELKGVLHDELEEMYTNYRKNFGIDSPATLNDYFNMFIQNSLPEYTLIYSPKELYIPGSTLKDHLYLCKRFNEKTKNLEKLDRSSLNSGDQIFVGFGTGKVATTNTTIYSNVIDTFCQSGFKVFITTGGNEETFNWLNKNYENNELVKVVKFCNQIEIISQCKFAIMHGGANGLHEAIHIGVPCIVSPFTVEQNINADLLKDLKICEKIVVENGNVKEQLGSALKSFQENWKDFTKELLKLQRIILEENDIEKALEIISK